MMFTYVVFIYYRSVYKTFLTGSRVLQICHVSLDENSLVRNSGLFADETTVRPSRKLRLYINIRIEASQKCLIIYVWKQKLWSYSVSHFARCHRGVRSQSKYPGRTRQAQVTLPPKSFPPASINIGFLNSRNISYVTLKISYFHHLRNYNLDRSIQKMSYLISNTVALVRKHAAIRRVSPRREVPEHIPRPDWADTGYPTSEERSRQQRETPVRSAADIRRLKASCALGRAILDAAHAIVKPGVTTDEIDRVVHDYTIEHGAYPSPLNYHSFPKSVCTSVNEVVCHGIPDQRELADGDIVNVDVSCLLNGWHGDLNETFTVGNVNDESKRLVKVRCDQWRVFSRNFAEVIPMIVYFYNLNEYF